MSHADEPTIILVGVSGAGKTDITLATHEILKRCKTPLPLNRKVSTRPQRPGEKTYEHVSQTTFERQRAAHRFIYTHEHKGHQYAVRHEGGILTLPASTIQDVQRRKPFDNPIYVGIDAPEAVLRARILHRDAPPDDIARRLADIPKDRETFDTITDRLDYVLTNPNPESSLTGKAYAALSATYIKDSAYQLASIAEWEQARRKARDTGDRKKGYLEWIARQLFSRGVTELTQLSPAEKTHLTITPQMMNAFLAGRTALAGEYTPFLPISVERVERDGHRTFIFLSQHHAEPADRTEENRTTELILAAHTPHLRTPQNDNDHRNASPQPRHRTILCKADDRPDTPGIHITFAPSPNSLEHAVHRHADLLQHLIRTKNHTPADASAFQTAADSILKAIFARKVDRWKFDRDEFPYGLERDSTSWVTTEGAEAFSAGYLPAIYRTGADLMPEKFEERAREKLKTLIEHCARRVQKPCPVSQLNGIASSIHTAILASDATQENAQDLVTAVTKRLATHAPNNIAQMADDADKAETGLKAGEQLTGDVGRQLFTSALWLVTPFLWEYSRVHNDAPYAAKAKRIAEQTTKAILAHHIRKDGSIRESTSLDQAGRRRPNALYGQTPGSCHANTLAGAITGALLAARRTGDIECRAIADAMLRYARGQLTGNPVALHDFDNPQGPRDTTATARLALSFLATKDQDIARRSCAALTLHHLDLNEERPHVLLDSYSGALQRHGPLANKATIHYNGGSMITGTLHYIQLLEGFARTEPTHTIVPQA